MKKKIDKPIRSKEKIDSSTVGVKIEGDNVVELGLYFCGLTELPESIINLSSLKKINLGYNNLSDLPESIGDIKSLKYLNLDFNKIKELSPSLGNLTNLEELSLAFNQLTALPESIGNIKSLKYLGLDGNNMKSIPTSLIKLFFQKEDFEIEILANVAYRIKITGDINEIKFLSEREYLLYTKNKNFMFAVYPSIGVLGICPILEILDGEELTEDETNVLRERLLETVKKIKRTDFLQSFSNRDDIINELKFGISRCKNLISRTFEEFKAKQYLEINQVLRRLIKTFNPPLFEG